MNKFRKCLKILYVLVISSLMTAAFAFSGFASEDKSPSITVDTSGFDPTWIVVTIFAVFALFFAIIALMYFLSKYISESQTRIKRLSEVESEETIQLYDDLEDAKWAQEDIPEDKPADVLLSDDISPKADGYEKTPDAASVAATRHGPVPERDMPGYDPYTDEREEAYKPLTPMPTPPNQYPMQNQAVPPQNTAQTIIPGGTSYAYTPVGVQPLVYRPDSDVEIIMHNESSVYPAAESAPIVEAAAPAPAPMRVRAYRRYGKMPANANTPVSADNLTPESADAAVFDMDMPRHNIRHLNIGPLGNAGAQTAEAVNEEPRSYTLHIDAAPEEEDISVEPIREAPILDPFEAIDAAEAKPEAQKVTIIRESADYEDATVEIIPSRRGANEKIRVELGDEFNDTAPMRTLDDVLDDLDEQTPEIEIEAAVEPTYEEELIFAGNDIQSSEDIPEDDVFDDEEGEARMFIDGRYTYVRYRTSFMSRYIQSEERLQDYYSVIKNLLISYKGVSAEIGWSCETFTVGGRVLAKINVRDKMLLVYLALDPQKHQNSRYRYTYLYDKYAKYKYSKVAMMVKVKSDRALQYTLGLIADMMGELGVSGGDVKDVDYRYSYETTAQLIARGLIKILPGDLSETGTEEYEEAPDVAEIIEKHFDSVPVELEDGAVFDFDEEAVEEPVEEEIEEPVEEAVEEPVEEVIEEPVEEVVEEPLSHIIHADVSEVDELLSDEEAIECIEIVEDESHIREGKLCEVNLDSICEKFEDGEEVTLDKLIEKHLVSRSAKRVKILARGVMTKTLTIYADKFSLQAVKMIKLAGGHAEQYK